MEQDDQEQEIPLADYELDNNTEPIQDIIDHRKQVQENRLKENELRKLVAERKALEIRTNIIKEKEKIERLKLEMEKPRIKKEWCIDCHRYEDQFGNPI